jgi:hypothetical protein
MGQGLAISVGAGPLCCVQDSCHAEDPQVQLKSKSTPSLQSVTAQSRNLQHPCWEVRAEAADFFGRLGSDSAALVVPMLIDLLLKDESWHVRQKAADALQELGPEAVSMASQALQKATQEDGHYTVRLAAAVALRKHGHRAEAALPLSATAAADPFAFEDARVLPKPEHKPDEPWTHHYEHEEPSEDTRLSSSLDISEISNASQPKEQHIVVQKGPSGKWGMDVDFVVNGTCLRVSKLKEGAISDWNSLMQDEPAKQVEIGDLLVEMNGVSGDSKELVKVMCKAEQLDMVVQKGL